MVLLAIAILTLQELARAARSAEKLIDTLNRELPVTLKDLRLTGKELSGLTDEVSGGVQSARNVVEQVDRGMVEARVQAQRAQITTRSFFAGASAALQVLVSGKPRRRQRPPTRRPTRQAPTYPASTYQAPARPVSTPPASAAHPENPVRLPELSHKTAETSTEKSPQSAPEKTPKMPPRSHPARAPTPPGL